MSAPVTSPGLARGGHDHPWVQPIIVAKTGSHADTALCGAKASVALYLTAHDWSASPVPISNFDEWLSGPFTKTVRRASYKDLAKVVAWCETHRVPYARFETGDSVAVALPPMRYADLPREVARLQVSGTDLPRESHTGRDPLPNGDTVPWVTLHVDGTLSTGKAAAQAAHALWAWMLDWTRHAEPSDIAAFVEAGLPVDLSLTSPDALPVLAEQSDTYSIRDAGLTEVAAGSLTAVAEA